jgi:hypothetical protein
MRSTRSGGGAARDINAWLFLALFDSHSNRESSRLLQPQLESRLRLPLSQERLALREDGRLKLKLYAPESGSGSAPGRRFEFCFRAASCQHSFAFSVVHTSSPAKRRAASAARSRSPGDRRDSWRDKRATGPGERPCPAAGWTARAACAVDAHTPRPRTALQTAEFRSRRNSRPRRAHTGRRDDRARTDRSALRARDTAACHNGGPKSRLSPKHGFGSWNARSDHCRGPLDGLSPVAVLAKSGNSRSICGRMSLRATACARMRARE